MSVESNPPEPLDLDAVEDRRDLCLATGDDSVMYARSLAFVIDDAPGLFAEVRRLRAALADAECRADGNPYAYDWCSRDESGRCSVHAV